MQRQERVGNESKFLNSSGFLFLEVTENAFVKLIFLKVAGFIDSLINPGGVIHALGRLAKGGFSDGALLWRFLALFENDLFFLFGL